ncbi:hypothetical protein J5N97_013389 [Dioscorea zingiberensis]|uniref:Aminotransferase class V domain-containing protein n=1 Tax=Dioscorea zingiberensis TaxID=325984 RepID=A0A9D5CQH2_9LILI|nr:hypothetical protein J5N97_013389 [Dioscorea zingiberensis]
MFCSTPLPSLRGDSIWARSVLGWKPMVGFKDLVKIWWTMTLISPRRRGSWWTPATRMPSSNLDNAMCAKTTDEYEPARRKPGDEVLLTIVEHHSAIVPWQLVSQRTGASLKYIGLTKEQVPDVDLLKKLLSKKTKLVVTHHVSNTLDSQSPLLCKLACFKPSSWGKLRKIGILGDQLMCRNSMLIFWLHHHTRCWFLVWMPPFLGGGEMIADVVEDYSTYVEPPSRF